MDMREELDLMSTKMIVSQLCWVNTFFLRAPSPFIFIFLLLPKDQLPTTCLCNKNTYAPQAIRSYIFSLLQVGYQTCALRTMIKDFADSLV